MSEREAGWYWVKFSASSPWECMEWARGEWEGVEPEIIGPHIPAPDEPWRLVPVELIDWIHGAQELMRALPDSGGWPAAARQADTLLKVAPKP